MWTIRPTVVSDGPALQDIERSAGERFRTVGLDALADDEPFSIAEIEGFVDTGTSWVVTDDAGTILGYVVVDRVDDHAHIEQVSVLPDHQGRGVGRALVDHVEERARAAGDRAVTLTTFTDVPWNRPLYEHLGYRVLDEDEIGPGLRSVRRREADHGLDPATRVCMVKDLLGR